MIDLKRYEGHTPGPYLTVVGDAGFLYALNKPGGVNRFSLQIEAGKDENNQRIGVNEVAATRNLFQDAPAILAAYVERGRLLKQCIVPLKALYGADNPLAQQIAAELEVDRGN